MSRWRSGPPRRRRSLRSRSIPIRWMTLAAARSLGRSAGGHDFPDLAGQRDDRAVLGRVQLGVLDGLFVALHGQLVAPDGRFRGGEVRFARGGADDRFFFFFGPFLFAFLFPFPFLSRSASLSTFSCGLPSGGFAFVRGGARRGRAFARGGALSGGARSGRSRSGPAWGGCAGGRGVWRDGGAAVAAASPAPEPEPVEVSPPVSSSLARLASAACRVALACSSVTSALCGSSVASS